jgi:hypothetical protein
MILVQVIMVVVTVARVLGRRAIRYYLFTCMVKEFQDRRVGCVLLR